MSPVQTPVLQRPARKEDARLVSGRGAFTSDHVRPDSLHLVVVRSVHAHAQILSVRTDAARSAPGVRWVATAEDMDALGAQPIPHPVTVKSVDGVDQTVVRMPILAKGKVHFVGQPVVFVVADTLWQAMDAAEQIEIDYEPLDAVVDVRKAMQAPSPQLHAQAPNNLSVHFSAGDEQAVTLAFERAHKVSRLTLHSQRLIGAPMEPRSVVAHHDASSGVTVVHTPSQGINAMRGFLSTITGLPTEAMRIETQDVGGSFGLRGGAYSEHAGVILAARHLGASVAWVGSRSESFLSDWHGRALILEGEMALDEQGRILAIRFNDWVDVGAYNAMMSTFIGTRNLSITMGGVYKVPALFMQSRMIYTNTTPISAYRGAGRPDIAYAIERLVDHAAHEHGFDPAELRRLNFIGLAEFPYKTPMGNVYDACHCEEIMDRALELADRKGFAERRAQAQKQGKLRGLGFSVFLESSGAGGVPKDQVRAQIEASGRLALFGVTGPSGQGHETSFAHILQTHLGWPMDKVVYRAGDPSQELVGNGTGGSRSLYGAGSALVHLCQCIQEALKPLAQAALGASSVKWDLGHWVDEAQATQRISVAELIEHPRFSELSQTSFLGEASSGVTYPNGCHVAEIEIDPETGETCLVNYVAVDDLGRVISAQLVKGQVHGGVAQGWGQAFCEQAIYDSHGQLLTGSFMDYAMPRIGDVSRFVAETVEVPTPLNLLGSKGVGESGCTGSLPALANAMVDALRPFGVQAMDMPFTPEKVWRAIHHHAPR